MTQFTIRKTEQDRFLVFTPLGHHISGTAYRTQDEAHAEITGWVSGWNASLDREPIRCWSWEIKQTEEQAA